MQFWFTVIDLLHNAYSVFFRAIFHVLNFLVKQDDELVYAWINFFSVYNKWVQKKCL